MSDDLEIERGSGNVFRDMGYPNPDLEQLRAELAARIVRALNARKLTVRAAKEVTGIAAADFSRIRNSNLGRFTVDRLMTILDKLGVQVTANLVVSDPAEAPPAVVTAVPARVKHQAWKRRPSSPPIGSVWSSPAVAVEVSMGTGQALSRLVYGHATSAWVNTNGGAQRIVALNPEYAS
jgi:predicted XRE-type DNA-binding protein